jgi:hypothetical protein
VRIKPEPPERVLFSFQFADRRDHGEWRWPTGDDAAEMLDFLYEMGQLTWQEVWMQTSGRHRKHHEQEIASVCKKAQDLISGLGHADIFDQLFRFRVGAKKRLWGYELAGVFYILWWDADHLIYPTEPG